MQDQCIAIQKFIGENMLQPNRYCGKYFIRTCMLIYLIFNEYTRFDPTLPHLSSIKCPNLECLSNKGTKEQDVIYIRVDDKNMKYTYLCYNCNFTWKP